MTKSADSQGIALGALSLPWCFAALQASLLTQQSSGKYPEASYAILNLFNAALYLRTAGNLKRLVKQKKRQPGAL